MLENKATIFKWCTEFSKECQQQAHVNPDAPNELELMKENLRLRKELEEDKGDCYFSDDSQSKSLPFDAMTFLYHSNDFFLCLEQSPVLSSCLLT